MNNFDEIKTLLKKIGSRALERDIIKHRPLICYALHPEIISDEEYTALQRNYTPIEWLQEKYYKGGGVKEKQYVVGVLVFLIRLFFEESKGSDQNKQWKILNAQQKILVDMICVDGTWKDDYGFPNEESWDLREWMKYQCWLLKCGEKDVDDKKDKKNNKKGEASSRLKNNERVYKLYRQPSCSDVLEVNGLEQLCSELTACSELAPYVAALLKTHWREYLLSLSAIVAEDEILPDEDEWRWLQTLRNIEVKKELKHPITAQWVLTPGMYNDKELWIELVPDWKRTAKRDRKYFLKQGDIKLEGEKKQTAAALMNSGFDISSGIELYKKTHKKKESDIAPIHIDTFVFFRHVQDLKKGRYLTQIKSGDNYTNAITILHREQIQSVEISRQSRDNEDECIIEKCEALEENQEVRGIKGVRYSVYALPTWNKERIKPGELPDFIDILVNGESHLRLKNPKRIIISEKDNRLAVSSIESGVKIDNVLVQQDFVKVDYLGNYYLIRTSHESMTPIIPMVKEARDLKWLLPQSLHWEKLNIRFYGTRGKYYAPDDESSLKQDRPEKEVNFIVLPDNWRSECAHASDWHMRIEKDRVEKWVNRERGLIIRSSINADSPLIWWWKTESGAKDGCLNAADAHESDKLQVYASVDIDYGLFIKWNNDEKYTSLNMGWANAYSFKSIQRFITDKKRTGLYTVVLRRKNNKEDNIENEEYVILKGENR